MIRLLVLVALQLTVDVAEPRLSTVGRIFSNFNSRLFASRATLCGTSGTWRRVADCFNVCSPRTQLETCQKYTLAMTAVLH